MKIGTYLRLSAILIAGTCLSSEAFAVGNPSTASTVYSSESIRLGTGGNTVRISGTTFSYNTLGGNIPGGSGVTVTGSPPLCRSQATKPRGKAEANKVRNHGAAYKIGIS